MSTKLIYQPHKISFTFAAERAYQLVGVGSYKPTSSDKEGSNIVSPVVDCSHKSFSSQIVWRFMEYKPST